MEMLRHVTGNVWSACEEVKVTLNDMLFKKYMAFYVL
jgi:hypothetical protein